MTNNEDKTIKIISLNNNWPFSNWNISIQDYILLNLYWLNFIKKFNLDGWIFGLNYYVNFDNENDRDFSTDVIFIKNKETKKMLVIAPITNYEKQFENYTVYIGIFKKEDHSDLGEEYDILSIEIDLTDKVSLSYVERCIKFFLSDQYGFDVMENMIANESR